MTNDIYGSDSAVPSGLGLLFHHPTLERVGYSRASLREKGFRSVDRFDQCIAEKCPNSRRRFSNWRTSSTQSDSMISLLQQLLIWLRPERPLRRYRVTARHNPFAFRRVLLRETLLQLKSDPAFAALPERRHT